MKATKHLMRIAVGLEQRLAERDGHSFSIPSVTVDRCHRLVRQLSMARERQWFGAASQTRDRLRHAIDELKTSLNHLDGQLIECAYEPAVSTVRHIYDDLIAIHEEFEHVEIDCRKTLISVTTESLELEGVELGRFRIQLDWSNLRDGHPRNFRVIALDPVPAAANDSVTHPHVQDETLCEGDGHLPIVHALQQGRLFDFFTIVTSLLRTYNSGSPYVALSDWFGASCAACGCTTSEDDIRSCEKCETALCSDCYEFCESCSGLFCNECTASCERCGEYRCCQCLETCSVCESATCQGCLVDTERCSDCHEKENEETADDDAETGFGNPATVSAIHANSMGQTAVPA